MPSIKRITIAGFRGFAEAKSLFPGLPNGNAGSGLTVIVGPNNAGKSTITEAIVAATQSNPPPFHVGQRNAEAGSRVRIDIELTNGQSRTLRSADSGGSLTTRDGEIPDRLVYAVPSRRQFASAFGTEAYSRSDYASTVQHQANRQMTVPLHAQLNLIAGNEAQKKQFDTILTELMGYTPDWTIDQHETGQNFLKYTVGKHTHSSDGLGDGIVSLFSIAASLHEASKEAIIVIDEPELSLHPQFQKGYKKARCGASNNASHRDYALSTAYRLALDCKRLSGRSSYPR